MSLLKIAAISIATLCFCSLSSAEVSIKNGNYDIASKDIVYPGGFEPKIERVYNSKTAYKGIFGNGWGNEYEVYLQVAGDGSLVVHEYGGGADNLFTRPTMSPEEIAKTVDQIAAVAQAQGDVSGEQNVAAYRRHLSEDATFRRDQWSAYVKKSLLQPVTLPVGTKLISNRFSYQVVTVMHDGYRRDMDNGRIEFYRTDGKLRQISDKNGNYIAFSYDVPHQIGIRDNFSRTMALTKNEKGLVTHIEGSNQETVDYRYNDDDELVFVRDTSGSEYTYEYSPDNQHNLIKMTYPDKSTEEIAYYPYDQFENVKSVKSRDNSLTEYSYTIDKQDRRHYTVTVRQLGSADGANGRQLLETDAYEYMNQTKPDGEEYTSRLIQTVDGKKTDTSYNENDLPTRIEQDGEATTFAYDAKGHVTHKVTPSETSDLTYDPVVDKVTSIRISDTKSGQLKQEAHFTYDAKGNLLTASSGDKSVRLQYDAKGRISEMDPNVGGAITFAYNANSKPITITVLAHLGEDGKPVPAGSINVTYTDAGEIEKVDSDGGRAIALAVTTSFQSLLDIIRPADVTFAF